MWGDSIEEEDDFAGSAPLTKSCLNNDLDFVEEYICALPADRVSVEVNRKDSLLYGDTPLMLAANTMVILSLCHIYWRMVPAKTLLLTKALFMTRSRKNMTVLSRILPIQVKWILLFTAANE